MGHGVEFVQVQVTIAVHMSANSENTKDGASCDNECT